ncbi:ATP-binding protein [Streptomyces sp. FB2]|uniref:ATP-binding protein n=1 Tax=Streptomyces sp. FB2 TaxID=2902454 RepID=UPI001F23B0A3|nr:ATP-binding protein [Streptomyces sp. FB2]
MSQLRAPATRADRREGGRHGRPAARTAPALPETQIRPQLLRLAVLPPVAVSLSASAAVLFVVRSTGAQPSPVLWTVLAGALSVTLAGIVIAAVAADRAARTVSRRIGALRRASARGEAELRALVEALRRGDGPPQRKPRGGPPDDADDFDLLAADLARAHDGAIQAVVQASQLSSQAGSEQKLEVFVNLARRLQSLVHREISILDELENEMEDPDLLKGLFHVDHLATRIRRHAENLAVLGGAVSRRQWSNPVPMTEVLRSAIAEVEQYSRVKLVPPIDGTLRGHAVADVIHLLAELVENATVFSAPHTQVLLRANLVTSGLAVEVEDRGLGMPVGEQARMNALLADPDQVNVASLLSDGRIGLFVVSQLAKRHGIHVRLQTNIYGGVQAVLVVPQGLLGTEPGAPLGAPRGQEPQLRTREAQGQPTPPAGIATPAPVPQRAGRQAQAAQRPPQHRRPAPDTAAGGARTTVPAPAKGDGPPLPVRGSHMDRANPAEAVPGISAEDRRQLAENSVSPLTPRGGAVRGTMGKPQLPRRRAQEHIAPQLRDGPVARQESDQVAGHDPGLMAAFQRGIGLAETQQHMESTHTSASHTSGSHMSAGHTAAGHMDASSMGSGHHLVADALGADPTDPSPSVRPAPAPLDAHHTGARHTEVRHMTSLPSLDAPPMGASPMGEAPMGPTPMGSSPTDASSTETSPRDASAMGGASSLSVPSLNVPSLNVPSLDVPTMGVPPMGASPLGPSSGDTGTSPTGPAPTAEAGPGQASGTDQPTWPDGSAPAG